jgi:hypothetical protein
VLGDVAIKKETPLWCALIMTRPYYISVGIQRYVYWPDGTYQADYTDGRDYLGFVSLVHRSGAGVLTVNLQMTNLPVFLMTLKLFPLAGARQLFFAHGLAGQSQLPANWHTLIEPASMPLHDFFYYDANGVRQESKNEESVFCITCEEVLELDDPTTPDQTIATIWEEMNQLIVRQ